VRRVREIADVRFGGAWTRTQSFKNDLFYGLACASLACAAPFPRSILRPIGRAIGTVAYAFGGTLARKNVAAALDVPEKEARRIARAAFENLGGHAADLAAVLGGAPFEPLPIDEEAIDAIESARREGRGVVFASAHLGPWERVAQTLVARGVPLVAVAREAYDPRLNRLYDALRSKAGLRVIYRGNPRAPKQILRALHEGLVLGMPMDLRTRASSVLVPFFGAPALAVVGPARIALRTGAAVVVSTVEGPTLRITATRISGADNDVSLTAQLMAEIERRIRTIPEEWLWMHPRWDG